MSDKEPPKPGTLERALHDWAVAQGDDDPESYYRALLPEAVEENRKAQEITKAKIIAQPSKAGAR